MGYVLAAILWLAPQLPVHQVVRDAIRHLAPHVGPRLVRHYTRIITREAKRRSIESLLVVAFIQTETRWDEAFRSATNDWGLCQIHVAARGSQTFLGRERELLDPQTNVREWCRLAVMWRAYHQRECQGQLEMAPGRFGWLVLRPQHPWWAHLKWGYRVKNTEHAEKVRKLYHGLRDRFRRHTLVTFEGV